MRAMPTAPCPGAAPLLLLVLLLSALRCAATACAPGQQVSPGGGGGTCADCPAGRFDHDSDAGTACRGCRPGYISRPGSIICVQGVDAFGDHETLGTQRRQIREPPPADVDLQSVSPAEVAAIRAAQLARPPRSGVGGGGGGELPVVASGGQTASQRWGCRLLLGAGVAGAGFILLVCVVSVGVLLAQLPLLPQEADWKAARRSAGSSSADGRPQSGRGAGAGAAAALFGPPELAQQEEALQQQDPEAYMSALRQITEGVGREIDANNMILGKRRGETYEQWLRRDAPEDYANEFVNRADTRDRSRFHDLWASVTAASPLTTQYTSEGHDGRYHGDELKQRRAIVARATGGGVARERAVLEMEAAAAVEEEEEEEDEEDQEEDQEEEEEAAREPAALDRAEEALKRRMQSLGDKLVETTVPVLFDRYDRFVEAGVPLDSPKIAGILAQIEDKLGALVSMVPLSSINSGQSAIGDDELEKYGDMLNERQQARIDAAEHRGTGAAPYDYGDYQSDDDGGDGGGDDDTVPVLFDRYDRIVESGVPLDSPEIAGIVAQTEDTLGAVEDDGLVGDEELEQYRDMLNERQQARIDAAEHRGAGAAPYDYGDYQSDDDGGDGGGDDGGVCETEAECRAHIREWLGSLDVDATFARLDINRDGKLGRDELEALVDSGELTEKECDSLWRTADADQHGCVDLEEFHEYCTVLQELNSTKSELGLA
eukprot:SAG22_NODE_65_length_23128_cov_51.766609_10_plen_716_part_00